MSSKLWQQHFKLKDSDTFFLVFDIEFFQTEISGKKVVPIVGLDMIAQ